ncbi:MAG: hypothetical protein QXF85_02850 [Candidatus Micrarchaeaceae archaeon]
MNDNEKEYLVNEINKEIDNAIKENESLRAAYLQLTIKEEELLAEKKKLEKEEARILANLRISNSLLVELSSTFNQFERTREINAAETLNKILNLIAISKIISERKINMTKDD